MQRETPLHISSIEGTTEQVSLLIEKGADLDVLDKDGNAPIHHSIVKCHIGILQKLTEAKANVNMRNEEGKSPVYLATELDQDEFVMILISFNANVGLSDENKVTPLHIAADHCNLNLVTALIKAGAPINAVDVDKNSPLHFGSQKMNKKIVEALINSGADTKLMNSKGLTPLQGVRLTFSKYMKQLVAQRDENPDKDAAVHYLPGQLFSQTNTILEQESDLREMFCLLCKRRNAIAAMVPCGHLCCCEVCLRERVPQLKQCPYCKDTVSGAVNILHE